MNIIELNRHASVVAQVFLRKLTHPEIRPDIEGAEFHINELTLVRPPYLHDILRLNTESESSVLASLACLSLDYPVIFDDVLEGLKDDDRLRGRLAHDLGTVEMSITDNSIRIDLLGKMLDDSNDSVRAKAVDSLKKYWHSDRGKIEPLLLKVSNDNSRAVKLILRTFI